MSTVVRQRISTIAVIVAMTTGTLGYVQAVAVMPYRLDQAERELHTLRDMRDRLVRIEESVKNVEKRLERQNVAARLSAADYEELE